MTKDPCQWRGVARRWLVSTGATTEVRCPSCATRNRVPADATGTPQCASCHVPLPWVVSAGDRTFDAVAVRSPLPVLVDLWAPWRGPCRAVAPIVERVAAERAGRLKVVKVNVDEAPRTAARYGVQGIPTLLLLAGGSVRDRIVGAPPEARMRARVDAFLGSGRPATPGPDGGGRDGGARERG